MKKLTPTRRAALQECVVEDLSKFTDEQLEQRMLIGKKFKQRVDDAGILSPDIHGQQIERDYLLYTLYVSEVLSKE